MSLRFEEVWWLGVAVLALPLGVIGLRWMRAMASARRWSAVVARAVLMVVIAMLLAGASMVRMSDRLAVVAVFDVSGSVERFFEVPAGPGGEARNLTGAMGGMLERMTEGKRRDDLLGVLYVDAKPRAVQALGASGLGELPEMSSVSEGTDLERAVRLASAMIPPDASGRVLLVSDGNQTSGDVVKAAREVARARGTGRGGVTIDVVPLEYSVQRECLIESVDAPPVAPAEARVTVRVVIASSAPVTGELRLSENGQAVDINGAEAGMSRRLSLPAGRHVELVNVALSEGRTHRFDAVFEADAGQDRVTSNNTGAAFTVTPGRGAVLIVDGDVSPGAAPGGVLAKTLREAGFEVQAVGAEGVRAELLWLQGFDIVLLDNVAADALPKAAQNALAGYVTDLGGGLVMIGGVNSFGAGGWKGTPIEALLPVLLDLPEKLETPSTAIVLVIDNSGSMNRSVLGTDRSQQDIANEGAALAIESMDKSDMVGVIVFNSTYDVRVPLQRNLDAKANARIVRSISADGGTNLPPALGEAQALLKRVDAESKHVIVLSDGVSANKEAIPDIVESMRKDGIKVSTIAVGNIADTNMMSEMAREGGGVYYRVVDPTLLPRVFVKAVRVVRSPMVREQAFDPVRLPSGSTVLDGIGELPELNGVTLTQARNQATVSNVLATPLGEPVLATWSAGLGRVGAFTSDSRGWSSKWIASPVYSKFWAQLVRGMSRPPSDRAQNLFTELDGNELRIRLEEIDERGRPMDGLVVPASVYAPDGRRSELRLSQIGPGQYEGVASADDAGTFVVTLAPRQAGTGGKALAPVVGGIVKASGAEYRALKSNAEVLREVARVTGGRVLAMKEDAPVGGVLFDRSGVQAAMARVALWKWLMIGAIGVMLLDVATRRVAWDRLLTREFGSQVKREAAAGMRDRTTQAARSMTRLRDAEQKIERTLSGGLGESEPAKLSEEDAAAVAEAEAQRRREARIAARRAAQRAETPGSEGAPVEDRTSTPAEKPAEEGAGGLLEAKRRARKRFDEEQGG